MVKCKKVFCFLLKSTFYLNIQGELSIMFAKIYDWQWVAREQSFLYDNFSSYCYFPRMTSLRTENDLNLLLLFLGTMSSEQYACLRTTN